jgi:uncharacterized protein (TIGR04255 family)
MSIVNLEKQKKEIPLLLYPPLIEVIFELHWDLETDKQTGRVRDPSYPMLYGRLYERLKKSFPYTEDLPANQVHPEASPYVVRHRIRKEKNGYPLIQVGPGIATLNMAGVYSWTDYSRHIVTLVEAVSDIAALNFKKCELRYFNGVRVDQESPLGFLSEKMHVKLEMDTDLFILNPIDPQPNALNLAISYPLRQPMGNLAINVHLGQMNSMPAYLFQTQVVSLGEWVPTDPNGFKTWMAGAHNALTQSFFSICKGPLMNKFCGGA